MKKHLLNLVLSLLCVSFAYSGGTSKNLVLQSGTAKTTTTFTIANSNVDTLKYVREAGVSGLAFSMSFIESVSVTSVIARRVIDGKLVAAVTADTLTNFAAFASTAATAAVTNTVTLAPLADEYWFFITYAGSANGVTTPTATAGVRRQYAK